MSRPKAAVFDIESDGLLDTITEVFCIVVREIQGPTYVYHDTPGVLPMDGSLADGLNKLREYSKLIGHNIQGYDISALQKVYPGWGFGGEVFDTLVVARLLWPDVSANDWRFLRKNPSFPKKLIGRHSLEAWGHRLGEQKDQVNVKGLTELTQTVLDYCVQDTATNLALYERQLKKEPSRKSVELEHRFAAAIEDMTQRGWWFDADKGEALVQELMGRRAEIDGQIQELVPPYEETYFTPKKKLERKRTVVFNPNSRQQVGKLLIDRHGWKPEVYTKDGHPSVGEDVLSQLDYPEAKLLDERFLVQKRLDALAEGKEAWFKHLRNNRIHGRVNHNGAVTGRCTHSKPNMANIPAVGKPYGTECRDLFRARPGWLMVGADASGLELRCLAHYMQDERYTRTLLDGDIHVLNMAAWGLAPADDFTKADRDRSKTCTYAFLYGCFDKLLGELVCHGTAADGAKARARFLRNLPQLGKLIEQVQKDSQEQGYLIGLDGRRVPVRHLHAALNTLLQCAGAVIMKQATVNLRDWLAPEAGLVEDRDWGLVGHVHDEMQAEASPECSELLAGLMERAIVEAGPKLKFRLPLAAEAKTGPSWASTH